jgi:hypothetical protein
MKREQEKKRKQLKRKSEKQKKNLRDLLGLPQRMLFKPQLQPMPLHLVHLIQHRPMHRQQMKQKTMQLILQPDGGHQEGYVFTILGRLPEGGHQVLESWQK